MKKLDFDTFVELTIHLNERVHRRHAVSEHEIGQHRGGAPGDTLLAVDEDLAPGAEGLVNKVGDLCEVD